MKITTFNDVNAKSKAEQDLPWPDIVARLNAPEAYPTKSDAPLLKLGTFGDMRTDKGALRSDANMHVITGIEGDYDGEQVAPTEAIERLERYGIRACVYTSPSHTDGKPRWRVLAPLSTELPKGQRDMLVRRLNGALGGILTSESFTDSQTYYYGRVNGHPYACLVTFDDPEDGQCINELPKLDEIAIGKPKSSGPKLGGRYGAEQADAEKLVDLRSALAAMPSDDYNLWAEMGLALYPLGAPGYALWTEWSQKSSSYNPRKAEEKWRTDFHNTKSGYKAVFDKATKEYRWVNPRGKAAQLPASANKAGDWQPKPRTAAALLQAHFKPLRWTLADILPRGLFILAAAPKIGKSWFGLQLMMAVASGGTALGKLADKGECLYLALEDNDRRLQKRLLAHRVDSLADKTALQRAQFEIEWKRVDEGGIEALYAWVDAHPDARLIVIDTLERIRPKRNARADKYAEDYAALTALKTLCDAREITVLVIHHTRKAPSDDPFDMISGTQGLAGAADGALLLHRQRGMQHATLAIVGRDIEQDGTFAVNFNRETCLWEMEGLVYEVVKSKERQAVVDLLIREGKPMQAKDIAEELGRKRATIRSLLRRMVDDSYLKQNQDKSYEYLQHPQQ